MSLLELDIRRRSIAFPHRSEKLEQFGFKFSPGGAHISRTMMLRELVVLFMVLPISASSEDYTEAILSKNLLSKGTESTRLKTLRHLRELYGLSPDLPIFRALRRLHASDSSALGQLALLCAWTRDPLLRATTPAVIGAQLGHDVSVAALADAVSEAFPNQYSALNQQKIARNARATWTSSGHLTGRTHKFRRDVVAQPASVAYAFLLGDVSGLAGEATLSSPWCRLLDLNAEGARSGAAAAHRHGLLNFRAAGSVIEVTFPANLLN